MKKPVAILPIIMTFIFTACDGAGKTNEPPQIDDLSGSTVRMNENTTSAPLAFQIRDSETTEGNLEVRGVSSNLQLISSSGIVITGNNRDRQVTLTPNENEHGTAMITIVVVDQENDSVSTTFNLIVDNVIPGISNISNQSIPENSSGGSANFTISASEFPVNELVVTATSGDQELIPNSNISVTGTGANRTVHFEPAFAKNGSTVIHVSVSDPTDADESSTSFTVTVTDFNFSLNAGLTAFENGDYDDAFSHFMDAQNIDGQNYLTYSWTGWVWLKKGDPTSAYMSFTDALSLDNSDPDTHAGFAFSENAGKKYEDSNTHANNALSRDSQWSIAHGLDLDYAHLYLLRAMNYFNLGDYDNSLEEVQLLDEDFNPNLDTPEGVAELAAKIQDLQGMMKM